VNILAVYFSIPKGGDPNDIPFLPWLLGGVLVFLFSLWLAVEITEWLRRK
jgi:hypothetical protein